MPIPEGNPVTIQDGTGASNNQAVVSAAGALKVDASAAGGGTVSVQLLNGGVGITGNQSTVSLSTQEVAPVAANILTGTASADGATIITVPVNRIWQGTIMLSGAVTVAAGASGAVNALPNVTTTGATAVPAAGAVLHQLAISLPANLAGSVTGDGANDAATITGVTVYAGSNAGGATLKLTFNSATAASATAVGYLR